MTVTVEQWKVTSSDGHSISVRADKPRGRDTPFVTVAWTCGDTRTFTLPELQQVIENIRATAEVYSDVWMLLKDHNGEQFAVRIADGELYADTRIHFDAEPVGTHVPWASVRKALRRAVRQLEPPALPPGDVTE